MPTLHHKLLGSGEPVIILHGLLGMLDNWKTFGKLLAEDYSVFLVDLRNHGRSPHVDEMAYSNMASDLIRFMDDHWLYGDVRIIGHSMGGKVAMQVALDDPDRIRNLMVIDIAPRAYEPSHQRIFEALQSIDLTSVPGRKGWRNPY